MATPALLLTNYDGFGKERFQEPKFARPVALLNSGDLKGTAATALGLWYVPAAFSAVIIRAVGFHSLVAGGAQTIAGTLGLYRTSPGGSPVALADANSVQFVAASVASHAAGAVVETSTCIQPNLLVGPPSYLIGLPGDVFTWEVVTAGTGAGDQTVLPYLIYSIAAQTVVTNNPA